MINVNKFEWQVDPKACKYYLDDFDVIFVDDQHDLRFCRYSTSKEVNILGKYHMVVKDNNLMVYNINRDRALCFYDMDHHCWCSKTDDHRYKCWEAENNIFFNVLVGISIDEITGSKTDLSVDDITHRIKSRFGIWYDEYVTNRYSDKLFDESVRIPQTRNNEERFKFRNGKYIRATCQPPQPKFVQFNGDYTTVVWKDGSHTVVKKAEGEEYDGEKAILFAIVKHLCGDNGCEMDRYFEKFFKDVHVHVKNEKNINKEIEE